MAGKYKDFYIRISKGLSGYKAKVWTYDYTPTEYLFDLALDQRDIDLLILKLGKMRHSRTRRVESPEISSAKKLGKTMFDSVFINSARNMLYASLKDTQEQGKYLRIRIDLSQALELADLPWEFLYDSENNNFFCLSQESPIVRDFSIKNYVRPLQITYPLNILFVVSRPYDYPQVDIETEWIKINDAIKPLLRQKSIFLKRLDNPSLHDIQTVLKNNVYHILHFIGHSTYNKSDEDGQIVLCDSQGHSKLVNGQELGILLRDYRHTLRLLILNSCEGGRTSRTDPFSGVAQSLIQQGISVVIAMQFEVLDTVAALFAYDLYNGITKGDSIETAVTEARKTIFSKLGGVDWSIPVIYTRVDENVLFDMENISHGYESYDYLKKYKFLSNTKLPALLIIILTLVLSYVSLFSLNENIKFKDWILYNSVATLTPSISPTLTVIYTTDYNTYIVKSGDTLSSIAMQFSVFINDLAIANGLDQNSPLRAGQELIIPIEQTPSLATGTIYISATPTPTIRPTVTLTSTIRPTRTPTPKTVLIGEYIVQSGDTLFSIAVEFNTTVDVLIEGNSLNPNGPLTVGQILVVPPFATVTPIATSTVLRTHVVQPGEWWYGIAREYGVDPVDVIAANPGVEVDNLQVGQVLIIPDP